MRELTFRPEVSSDCSSRTGCSVLRLTTERCVASSVYNERASPVVLAFT